MCNVEGSGRDCKISRTCLRDPIFLRMERIRMPKVPCTANPIDSAARRAAEEKLCPVDFHVYQC